MKNLPRIVLAVALIGFLTGCGGLGGLLKPVDEYAELERLEVAAAPTKISALEAADEAADGDSVAGLDVSDNIAAGGMSDDGTTKKYPLSLIKSYVMAAPGAIGGTTPATSIAADELDLTATASPLWGFKDSDAPGTDKEVAAIGAQYLSGADGAEYGAWTAYAHINGTRTAILNFDDTGYLESSYWPTFNQATTGSAGSLKSTATTGLMTITGPAAGETRAKTVRDADDTILELGGSYTPTGNWTWTSASGSTWPTFNQSTTGSAASLAISGQSGLLTFDGLTSTNRAKTVRDAADTLLELGGDYTPTGTWVWTSASVTWPTFNQNTTGTASNVTGTVAVANGGTGATTAATAASALGVGTEDSPQFTSIELGNASDTTLARSGAGAATIEGVGILMDAADTVDYANTTGSFKALTPITGDADDFAANFTGANLYGGTYVCNAEGDVDLPEPVAGMNFTVITMGDIEVDALPAAGDDLLLDGVQLDDNHDASNTGSAGDIAVFQYYDADGWLVTTNGWTEVAD
jgi:hypothetical protein